MTFPSFYRGNDSCMRAHGRRPADAPPVAPTARQKSKLRIAFLINSGYATPAHRAGIFDDVNHDTTRRLQTLIIGPGQSRHRCLSTTLPAAAAFPAIGSRD